MKRNALLVAPIIMIVISLNSISLSQENKKKLIKLQKKYDSLLLKYTEKHPDVVRLRTIIKKLEKSIEDKKKALSEAELIEKKKREAAELRGKKKREVAALIRKKKREKEGPALNPLLMYQKPGTWIKLPNKGKIIPKKIHGHCGIAIDPETSILYFFGSDTHNFYWNNDVWSYNPGDMTWKHYYKQDDRVTYQYKDGYRSTTTGRPWCMHTYAMTVWDPVAKHLIVAARPIHYKIERLPQAKPTDAWWEYDPADNKWEAVKNGPFLNLGECTYIQTIRKVIGFDSGCKPVAFYDPKEKTFELLKGWRGARPKGYTRKSVYDTKRDRVLIISSDKKLWSFDYRIRKWSEIKVANWPDGGIYGSWDYDISTDMLVSIWSEKANGGFGNPSGKSTIALCDLEKKEWFVHKSDPIAPYYGMSFKVAYDPGHEVTLYCVGNEIWSFKAPRKQGN